MSGHCVKCNVWRRSLHRDHIIPKFKGGPDTPENIQLLCANCHEDKTREEKIGSHHSEEHKNNITQGLRATWNSPERKKKQSERMKAAWASGSCRGRIGMKNTEEKNRLTSEKMKGIPKQYPPWNKGMRKEQTS